MTIEYLLMISTLIIVALFLIGRSYQGSFQHKVGELNDSAGDAIGNIKEDLLANH